MIFGRDRNQHKNQLVGAQRLWVCAVVLILLPASAFALQDSPALRAARPRHAAKPGQATTPQQPETALPAVDLEKYKPLLEELGRLEKKLEQNIQLPPPRTQSKLLPLLPASSSFYVSLPNYGDALHQANQIFLAQLKESPVLNDWWQNKAGMIGMMVEEGIEKFYQFTQYLGNEIVISGTLNPKSVSVLLIAEARKPGLKAFVEQIIAQYVPQPHPPLRVLTPQQLLTAKAQGSYKPLLLLVRPDFVVASTDLSALQSFNAQLNRAGGRFGTTPLGQRLTQAYASGAGVVIGADLQKLQALRPRTNPVGENAFQQSGFADMKFLVMESKYLAGKASSNMELSFNGPRQGIASWLASPAPLPGLDFLSPDAAYAAALMLKSPGQIFDNLKTLAESSNPMAGAGLEQAEMALKIKLKEDLFNKLGGHLTFAIDGPAGPVPAWKAIVQVSDPTGLQQTLKQLVAATNENASPGKGLSLKQEEEEGKTYYTVHFIGGQKPVDVHYAFADGYLVVAGTHAQVKDAIAAHQSGKSLARSPEFQALLPQEHSGQASAVFYQNAARFVAAIVQQMAPDLSKFLQSNAMQNQRSLMAAYGETSAIRAVSTSRGFDPSAALLVAAVAIPNILKSRNAAQETAAVAVIRNVITAEAQYSLDYGKGYAPDLARLGPGSQGSCDPSESHACLLNADLGCSSAWCTHDGFRFSLAGSCKQGRCDDFVVLATPRNPGGSGKNLCATSDAVIRSQTGPPLMEPISVEECQSWSPH